MLISVFGGQISTSRSLAAPWTSLATCLNSCPTSNSDFTGPGLASSSPTDPFLLPCVPFLNVSIMQMLTPKTQMSALVSFSSVPTRSSRIHWTFSAVSCFFTLCHHATSDTGSVWKFTSGTFHVLLLWMIFPSLLPGWDAAHLHLRRLWGSLPWTLNTGLFDTLWKGWQILFTHLPTSVSWWWLSGMLGREILRWSLSSVGRAMSLFFGDDIHAWYLHAFFHGNRGQQHFCLPNIPVSFP